MSLKPTPITTVPEQTARIARAAFPKGSLFMRMRDELGVFWQDEDFAHLFAQDGQPALCPWRLALVTLMQFAEQLSDRQAAEAVRSRIDWKYALGLELTDPGFHYSVLCEFRARLINSNSEHLLLERLLATFRANGLLKARGKQCTDSTHVLGAIRILNRLELVAESLRAALNALATTAPDWVRQIAQPSWFERYSYRIDEYRLPQEKAAREAYIRTIGEDGFALLDALDAKTTAAKLRELSMVKTFQRIWHQHYLRDEGQVRWRTDEERPPGRERFDSPYDVEARYSSKRSTTWSGYKVHVTETCEPDEVHLITHVETQPAVIQDVSTTAPIHMALATKDLLPIEHLVDAGYVDAQLLVNSQEDYGIELIGPTRSEKGWQSQVAGAYSIERFQIDWQAHRVTCPQGKVSSSWTPQTDRFVASTSL